MLFAALTLALVGAQASSAGGEHGQGHEQEEMVFVQTNELTGNQIVVFDRGADGRLTSAGTYSTGGNGGAALPAHRIRRLASQGSLVYDRGPQAVVRGQCR